MDIDWKINFFDCLTGTQDKLHNIILENNYTPEGMVIHAANQSDGKGRHNRVWQSASGNLYFSFLLRPNCPPCEIGQISLTLGLAISDYINKTISHSYNSVLKWPNDILIDNKKCCGILIDASPIIHNEIEYIIVGIGVNINSAPLDISACLQKFTDKKIDVDIFLTNLLGNVSSYYKRLQKDGFEMIRNEWISNTYPKGSKISVKLGGNHINGRFETIDLYGNLVLISDKSNNKIKISSGDVFIT